MRVLGIDCGVERTGYGVIESDGRTHSLLVAGVIRTSPSENVVQNGWCVLSCRPRSKS